MARMRAQRLGEEIQHKLAEIIDRKVKDPRKGIITITHVRVSPDLSLATVQFTALDSTGKSSIKEAKAVLDRASGFIRHELASAIKARIVPQLRFYYDDSLDKMDHINEVIREINRNDEKSGDQSS